MRVQAAFVADFATVRDNRLNVLDGGTNVFGLASLPGSLSAFVVLMLDFDDSDFDREVPIALSLKAVDGDQDDVEIRGDLTSQRTHDTGAAWGALSTVLVNLRNIPITVAGRYRVEGLVDNSHPVDVKFLVVDVSAGKSH